MEPLSVVRRATAGRDNFATLQKGVRHRDRLIQQTTGIITKVKNVTPKLITGILLDLLDHGAQAYVGLFAETRYPYIPDILIVAGPDGTNFDLIADNIHVERFLTFPSNRKLDRRPHFAAHLLHRVAQRQSLHRLAI